MISSSPSGITVRHSPRCGYTLLEVLVVIAIVVLVGLTLAGVQKVRGTAARAACLNNLHQLSLASQQYAGALGHFPAGVTQGNPNEPLRDIGWVTRLLPYLEQDAIWRSALAAFAKTPFFGNFARHPCDRILSVVRCPADPRSGQFHADPAQYEGAAVALSSYLGVNGKMASRSDGVLYVDSQTRPTDITDGTSNTLLIGERPPSPDGQWGWWYASPGIDGLATFDLLLGVRELSTVGPYRATCDGRFYDFGPGRSDNPCDVFHYWSHHNGGANFALCDGSVRFLRYSAVATLPALATRAGGETISE